MVYLWQELNIVQWAQLQPQEDLPFFLSFTNEMIIDVTNDINRKTEAENKKYERVFAPKKPIITKIIIFKFTICDVCTNHFFI